MSFFRALLAIDLAAGAVLLFFFGWAIVDGSIAYSAGMWLALLAFVGATVAAAVTLHRRGYRKTGLMLLMPVAWPAVAYGLFFLLVVIAEPNWR